jgi:NAD(P)-dependent dehydrogenase (short-subunit alcohol dehydrogenase family)
MIACDGPAPVPPFAKTITKGAEMQKVAVITAGGSGMGAAAARRLAADGFAVAILSSSGKGEALANELGGVGITGSNQSNDDVQRLVNATFEPDPAFPTSGVARAGLAAFTKLYADTYAPQGIRINNLLPGFINSLPEKEEFRARIPMGRYGRVEEIAGTVSFLASDASGYITGQNLRVDGGITRSV